MYKATVTVQLRGSVLDPQGLAIKNSLHSLGYDAINEVRTGKKIELFLEIDDKSEAEKQLDMVCKTVLANPVIEDYFYELEQVR